MAGLTWYSIMYFMDQKISEILRQLYDIDTTVMLTRPDAEFGDFSTNIAMQLAKQLGQNPRDIAEAIVGRLSELADIKEASVAGPGFINIRLTDSTLLGLIRQLPDQPYSGQKIVFEYSCPNAFKELHTGHLYQTIFGDIAARLMLVGGATLQRTSFGGDVGLHAARCLWGMIQELGGENPEKLSDISSDAFERANWISRCYVIGAEAYERDESTKREIEQLNQAIYKFHEIDDQQSSLAQVYWATRQWSFDYFEAFYELIAVVPMRYYPESQTTTIGMQVVKEQLAQGNLEESEGAVVYRGDPAKNLHTRVFITSKGLPTYETKDIGVIWLEQQDYQFDHRYLLTGNDQTEYMRVVFDAAETFRPELRGKMTHLVNGTVRFGDGQKMSSRLGNVTRAIEVVDIVRHKVKSLITIPEQLDSVSLGALKYAFAKYRLGGDIAFDADETVSLQGNSGPYIQYAHARARQILGKTETKFAMPSEFYSEDRGLVRKLGEYHEVVNLAIIQLEPHHICNYLFELAQEFNRYYEKNRVIASDKEQHRASLVALYADILKAGLAILGIEAPDKL